MTLSLPKFRIYPPDSVLQHGTGTFALVSSWAPPGYDTGGPQTRPGLTTTIPEYFLDNTDFTFDLMDYDYLSVGGYLLGGIPMSYYNNIGLLWTNIVLDTQLYLDGAAAYTKNAACGVMYTYKEYNLANIYTRRSTNTTTRINIINTSGLYAQQQIFVVALNGPNQGQKTTLQPLVPASGFPFLQGPIPSPYDNTLNRYYLPNHPTDPNAPDVIYYGLVFLYGAKITNYSTTFGYASGSGVLRVAAFTETVNADSPHVFQP